MFAPTKLAVFLAAALSVAAQDSTISDAYILDVTGPVGVCNAALPIDADIAGVSNQFFDAFPGYNTSRPPVLNPICGKTAQVTYQDKSVTVMLTDRCHDICHGVDDLELSPHAFGQLADISEGKISGISWKILD